MKIMWKLDLVKKQSKYEKSLAAQEAKNIEIHNDLVLKYPIGTNWF